MYASDYGFAADQSAWTTGLTSYNSYNSSNWMYMGVHEWIISPYNSGAGSIDLYAYTIYNYGKLGMKYANMGGYIDTAIPAVRPTFYLTSDVTYTGGTGTSIDPIRLG